MEFKEQIKKTMSESAGVEFMTEEEETLMNELAGVTIGRFLDSHFETIKNSSSRSVVKMMGKLAIEKGEDGELFRDLVRVYIIRGYRNDDKNKIYWHLAHNMKGKYHRFIDKKSKVWYLGLREMEFEKLKPDVLLNAISEIAKNKDVVDVDTDLFRQQMKRSRNGINKSLSRLAGQETAKDVLDMSALELKKLLKFKYESEL